MNNGNRLPVRIYWEDTDAGGIVYHASYLRFMERGRTELLREAGIDQNTLLAEAGVTFVVRSIKIDFKLPARLDDEIVVETHLNGLGGASLTLDQKVWRGGELLTEAEVICAVLSPATGRPARVPASVRARLVG